MEGGESNNLVTFMRVTVSAVQNKKVNPKEPLTIFPYTDISLTHPPRILFCRTLTEWINVPTNLFPSSLFLGEKYTKR